MKTQYEDQFQEIFKLESLRGERIHWKVNWFIYTIILLLSSSVYFIQGNEVGKYGMILSSINLLYNLSITWFIFKNKCVTWVRYFTMTLNVLSLSAYIYLDASLNSTMIPVSTAALLLFPVIILIGALRMDKYLIIWTTVLCIIAMDGLFFWFYNSIDPGVLRKLVSMDFPSQIYRTIYLAMCGLLVYSVPRSMLRVLKAQERLAKENFEHWQKSIHDALTGVYNRLYFEQYLSNCIQTAKSNNHKIALLYIDLDGFKNINDTYGHDLGDLVLKSLAEDISSIVGENEMLARIGGDEFVIVMAPIALPIDAENFGKRILSAIRQPKRCKNLDFVIGASIGISLFPDDAADIEQLISNADEAMYKVKKSGKDGITFYK